MYLRIGFSLALFITAIVFLVKWAGNPDAALAWRQLILAAIFVVGGLVVITSKKLGKIFQEFETQQEIENARMKAESLAKKEAAEGTGTKSHDPQANSSPVTNPETAKALQELEKLLYTRTISEEEYKMAKERVFLSKSKQEQEAAFAHLKQLGELHAAGIISDIEFAAAKLKALGF